MSENNNKRNYFKSSSGSVVLALIALAVVQLILHNDFWNWGKQNFYFGWVTGELMYRLIITIFAIPLIHAFIQKISWPTPKE